VKLLFDQNISYRVVQKLTQAFPEAMQVKQAGLYNKSDKQIWLFAKKQDFTIVTFDSDFYDFASLYGHPPKIIWLRIGNTSTNHLADFLISKTEIIKSFILNKEYNEIACLELNEF
jgi:predicted nuclease of predicted toxin-antitoxin system